MDQNLLMEGASTNFTITYTKDLHPGSTVRIEVKTIFQDGGGKANGKVL